MNTDGKRPDFFKNEMAQLAARPDRPERLGGLVSLMALCIKENERQSMRQNRDHNVKNNDKPSAHEKVRSKSKTALILGTLFSVLISIGAYSKDSLFVRFLIKTHRFSVVRSTSIGGTANSGFFRAYQTAYGELLAPVQVLLYLNIRNESDEPQTIEGILLEFQEPSNKWAPVKVLSYGNGYYADFATQLKKAKILNVDQILLEKNLGSASLAPHSVISGWLFLEYPEEYRNQNMLNAKLRLTLYSGFGEKEQHDVNNVNLPQDAAHTRSAYLQFHPGERDISKLPILAETDLMKRLEAERNHKVK
jgi:hypothetical protein